MRFLAGFLVGAAVAAVLAIVLMLIFSPSTVKSFALDDLASYRECALKAPVDQMQRDEAVARIDRLIERVRNQGVGFWEYAMATSDIDPLTSDKVLTADEWPRFSAELQSAEIVLVGVPAKAPAAVPAKN